MLELRRIRSATANFGILPWADPYVLQLFGSVNWEGRNTDTCERSMRVDDEALDVVGEAPPPLLEPGPDFDIPGHRRGVQIYEEADED